MIFEYPKEEALKNGMDINSLEELILDALYFLEKNNINWLEGIELINDLIYLKHHDDSVFSEQISEHVLKWIETKYDDTKILDYTIFKIEGDSEEKKSAQRLKLTIDTVCCLNPNVNSVLVFVQKKLKSAKTDFEQRRLSEAQKVLEYRKQKTDEEELNKELKDEILKKADEYFKIEHVKKPWYKEGNYEDLYCGLRETISEHESSYSIYWRLASAKYVSRSKRSMFGGGGALFLSKETDLIKMSGSAPIDWVEWFELEVHQQEIYWILEIDFSKQMISRLKRLLEVSTSEILKMVNDESKILVEDEEGILEYIKKVLDKYEIGNTLYKLKRSRNKNG